MTHRRIHSAEFKRDAVQLARMSGNLSHTARELGLNASLLRKWLNTEQEQGEAAFPGQGKQNLTFAYARPFRPVALDLSGHRRSIESATQAR